MTSCELGHYRLPIRVLIIAALMAVLASGCDRSTSDLRGYIQQVKQRPGGRIEPIPEMQAFETYSYPGDVGRSPFQILSFAEPRKQQQREAVASGPKPDETRPKEALEQFELDSLTYVGTLQRDNEYWALVQDPGGTIHRVQLGNYLGTNYGRITGISPTSIGLRELIANPQGGWRKRDASLALND